MLQRNPIVRVTAFVDWNSQVHAAESPKDSDQILLNSRTLRYVGKTIGKVLNSIDPTKKYIVSLRLYHGWRKGFEVTIRRKVMTTIIASTDFNLISEKTNIIIRDNVEFGDQLISASPTRLHQRIGCHLPNTLRNDSARGAEVEKMVDTAIASDLVDLAHGDRDCWLVVMAEDDDLVPPVFVAEGVRGPSDGRILLVRNRPETPFLKLDKLKVS
jgi:hypothetical protein